MGVDIHLKLCKYDPEDNLWHELKLYRKEKDRYKEVYLFEGRNSEMFAAMQNEEQDSYGLFPCAEIPLLSLDEELKAKVEEAKEYCYGFAEVSLSDMECYLYKHPTVVDYDGDWEDWKEGDPKPEKPNPIKSLFDSCCAYGEFAEGWHFGIDPYSRYKLLYWFDR